MKKENETKPLHYYGNKAYILNPMLKRKKIAPAKVPDYRDVVPENTGYYPKPK